MLSSEQIKPKKGGVLSDDVQLIDEQTKITSKLANENGAIWYVLTSAYVGKTLGEVLVILQAGGEAGQSLAASLRDEMTRINNNRKEQ